MSRNRSALPILIGGAAMISSAAVVGGIGLLARRHLRPKHVSLADADLSVDEWRGVVEFESADKGTKA